MIETASFTELAEQVECRRCGAAPTFSCITSGERGGKRRSCRPHAVRERPIIDAWRAGHIDGMVEALVGIMWDADHRPAKTGEPVLFVGSVAWLRAAILRISDSWGLELTREDLAR